MTQSVHISANYLLSIPTSDFSFKEINLIKTNITSFSDLNIFMMSDVSTS